MQCTGAAGIVTLTKQSIPAATVIAGRSSFQTSPNARSTIGSKVY